MKIRSGRIALALWLAALLMAGCATPQDKQAQADRDALCAVLDTDKDGKITKEEFMARTNDKAKGLEVFEKCDSDKNGYLTYDEIWSQRMMLPPELTITTPPLVRPGRQDGLTAAGAGFMSLPGGDAAKSLRAMLPKPLKIKPRKTRFPVTSDRITPTQMPDT